MSKCWPHSIRVRFNPRSRVGSDLYLDGSLLRGKLFQSTLPRGERPQALNVLADTKLFQSTLPRGERPTLWRWCSMLTWFQSTLPRGERPPQGQIDPAQAGVSIHAPAWGATEYSPGVLQIQGWFQSTLPRGERHNAAMTPSSCLRVSIHAPAWGATPSASSSAFPSMFQSTLPRGERPVQTKYTCSKGKFQSTLPRGERLGSSGPSDVSTGFNPRSRVGSDGTRITS